MLLKINYLRPNLLILTILLVALSLTWNEHEATSKVTWKESRGAPWPFLTLTEYRGPCPPRNFCTELQIDTLHPWALLLDILSWYVVCCSLLWGYKKILALYKKRA